MINRISSNNIQTLQENEVFVFGSNSEGKHYGGAARLAHEKFGAIMGDGHGLQGKSYAIDTMSGIHVMEVEVNVFIDFAKENTDKVFLVTELGCGIAGYKPSEVAPLFIEAVEIENIMLPEIFWDVIVNM